MEKVKLWTAVISMISAIIALVMIVIPLFVKEVDGEQDDAMENSLVKDTILLQEHVKSVEKEVEKDEFFVGEVKEDNIRKESINRSFYSTDGLGIDNVKVWCDNCLNKDEFVWTKEDGSFILSLKFEEPQNPTYRLAICYQYKENQDCIYQNHNYLNDIELPKFEIK